jgi:hypothetical protein
LSAVVPVAHRQPQERSAARQPEKRHGDRLPALQAVQAGRTSIEADGTNEEI